MREPKARKEKDGKYHLRFRIKGKDGKLHQKHFSRLEWKSGKDASAFYKEYMKTAGYDQHGMTVSDLFQLYIKDTPLKLRTRQNRERIHTLYIEPTIGQMIADQVDVKDIRDWQNKLLLAKGRITGKLLRDGYTHGIQNDLRTIFNYGVKMRYIPGSPFMVGNISRKEAKKVIKHWTPSEFQQFIDYAYSKKPIYAEYFTVLYWTGMRAGEVIALRYKDVDLIQGTLDINKTYDNVNKMDEKTPKSKNSCRKVVMTSQVKNIVERLVSDHTKAYGYADDAILFGFDEHLEMSTMQLALKRYIEASGVPVISLHGFRHSHVFFLRKMGFNPFEIAKRIGDDIAEVNKTYGQWFDELQKEMVAKIDEFNSKVEKTLENHDNVANMVQDIIGKA